MECMRDVTCPGEVLEVGVYRVKLGLRDRGRVELGFRGRGRVESDFGFQ